MVCGLIDSCARRPIFLCWLNPAQPCSTLLNPAKLCPPTQCPVSRGARPRTHPVVVRELDVPLAHGLADLGLNVHVQQWQEAGPIGLLRCPLQPLHFVLQGRDRRVLGPQLAPLSRRRPPPTPCDVHISVGTFSCRQRAQGGDGAHQLCDECAAVRAAAGFRVGRPRRCLELHGQCGEKRRAHESESRFRSDSK